MLTTLLHTNQSKEQLLPPHPAFDFKNYISGLHLCIAVLIHQINPCHSVSCYNSDPPKKAEWIKHSNGKTLWYSSNKHNIRNYKTNLWYGWKRKCFRTSLSEWILIYWIECCVTLLSGYLQIFKVKSPLLTSSVSCKDKCRHHNEEHETS